jgi:hypothetical protein
VLMAYANGLPFLRGTLLGDVGYTVGMFAVAAVVTSPHFVTKGFRKAWSWFGQYRYLR